MKQSAFFLLPNKARLDRTQIRVCLAKKGLLQQHLARKLRITNGYLTRLLTSQQLPTKELVAGMAAVLDVDPDTILLKEDGHAS